MTAPTILLAYIAGWQDFSSMPLERDAERLTHICYAFANIRDGEVVLFSNSEEAGGQPRAESRITDLVALRARHPHLKLLISIGGWSADGFSDAALTAESRTAFAASAIAFMQRYGFDGIDLDWEYPTNDMADIKARPEDKPNFTLMLADLRRQLDSLSGTEGRKAGDRYLLTIAAGAGQYYLDGVEMAAVAEQCDFVNLMTYDFYNGWATRAGHHTNLYNTPGDPDGDSCAKAVGLFTAAGLPRDKLVLGCAFYGRSLKGVGAAGLGAPGTPKSNGFDSFTLITELLASGRAVRHWDADAQAPWLLVDGDTFVSYDDAESILAKTDFIRREGLAGGFFWEYTEDRTDTLLTTLWQGLQ
ncbi:glycoside hydrolase family 18 protein [Jeongeupia naejangsanensis]|uniref:chitinase n=1 Tax=Jeongeupia naejangsanensis TaxID=613195 RepID=A0ABS2BLU9_9NEIS|nr:glycoside hydrolase family 18 protein [Jeongeupia naejangsanensis]MBM3116597.1 glycoside hydrolase family 18 protein [Jeongeupia naejangsanensis]